MSPYNLQRRSEALLNFTEKQLDISLPNNRDPASQALNVAVHDYVQHSSGFKVGCEMILEGRDDITPSNIGRRIFKSVIASAWPIELSEDRAAEQLANMTAVADWTPYLDIAASDEPEAENFWQTVNLPIVSNVSDRGKLLKSVALLHGMTWPLKINDLGASLNHNLKRLALEAEQPFLRPSKTSVFDRHTEGDMVVYTPNDAQTSSFNAMLHSAALAIREGVGYDLLDFDHPAHRRHGIATSRYLGELLRPQLNKQFGYLTQVNPENILSRQADVSEIDVSQTGEPADITNLCKMLYQAKDEAAAILEKADQMTKSTGKIVIQDFIEMTPEGECIINDEDWHKWQDFVWVKDKARPDLGWQKYYTVSSGRAEGVVIEPAARQAPYSAAYGLSA